MTMVDWRELERWGLDERRLPAGSVVLFREPSVWERHRWPILAAVALLLLQSALIAALLVHRALRRRVQRGIAERLRFETLLSDLSATFATGPVAEVDRQIETGLRRLVEDLGADRATVGALSAASDQVRATHSWTREGVAPLRQVIRGNATPWIVAPAPPGTRRPPLAPRGPSRRGGGRSADPRAPRHTLGRPGAAGRGRLGRPAPSWWVPSAGSATGPTSWFRDSGSWRPCSPARWRGSRPIGRCVRARSAFTGWRTARP